MGEMKLENRKLNSKAIFKKLIFKIIWISNHFQNNNYSGSPKIIQIQNVIIMDHHESRVSIESSIMNHSSAPPKSHYTTP